MRKQQQDSSNNSDQQKKPPGNTIKVTRLKQLNICSFARTVVILLNGAPRILRIKQNLIKTRIMQLSFLFGMMHLDSNLKGFSNYIWRAMYYLLSTTVHP